MKKIQLFILILFAVAGGLNARSQQEFRRNLEQISFIPKGQWITGISVNYSQSDQDNYQFLIVEDISGDTYSFKVSPMLLYCFKDNLAVGGKISYTRNKTSMSSADVIIDSETDYNIDNLYRISNNYSAVGVLRYYISCGNNKRFGFFNELQLQIGGGQSKLCNGSGDDLTGTYETNTNVNIGLAPGFIMFLNNYSAIEVNVGVLGFSYTHTKSKTDQIYVSHRNSQKANFNINLLSITFGMAFYL